MTLDVLLGSIFALLVYLGWRSGATGQALRVLAAICVVLFTAPASTLVRGVIFPEKTVVEPLLEVGSMFLASILIYIGVSLAGWVLIKAMRRTSGTLSAMDHTGGALLGAIKAGLLTYVFAICALFLQGPLTSIDERDRLHLRDGHITAFVAEHNILAPWRFPDVMRLERAIRVAHHASESRRGATQVRAHPRAADFIRREGFEALMTQQKLVQAANESRLALILANDEARAFLNDDAQVKALREVDWERVEQEVLGTAKSKEKEPGSVEEPSS